MSEELFTPCDGDNRQRAVVAVFHLRGDGRYELRSVYTVEGDDRRIQGYDVDWCEQMQEYVYHMSSFGSPLPLEVDGIYWSLQPDAVAAKPCRLTDPEARERNATRRLSQLPPEFVTNGSSDIFDWLVNNYRESEVEYCSICQSYVPTADTDYPCEHIWWCRENAGWSTPNERFDCACAHCSETLAA